MKLVIGIPTVRRERSYLVQTVNSLVKTISACNPHPCRIVIFDAEAEPGANPAIAEMQRTWPDLFTSDLITVLRRDTPLEIKTDGLSLKERWQRKQSLDCAELFQRCSTLAEYYLHVEDDVIACPDYLEVITRRLESHLARRSDWKVLSFYNSHEMPDDAAYTESQLYHHYFGLIGQLIRCRDLPELACYVRTHHEQTPVDVLVGRFVSRTGGRVYAHTPALFQHVGLISSLEGRVQMWEAPRFLEPRWTKLFREMLDLRDLCFYQPRALAAFLRHKLGLQSRSVKS